MTTLIDVTVPPLTFLLLAAVGMELTSADFARLRHQRSLVLAGLVGPLILLPPIAIALTWLFAPPADVAAALLLIAACPIGGISNTYSYLARASTALSVTLTGFSCLFAPLTIPLIAVTLEWILGRPLEIAPPVALLLGQLLLMLALPIALGMWVRRRWRPAADRWGRILQNLTFAGVGIVLVLIILDDPHGFVGGVSSTVPLAAVFVACCSATGWIAAVPFSADRRDRFTFAAEFGTRNLGVAMAIAVTLLGRVEFARFAYTYFLTEIPIMMTAIAVMRRVAASAIPLPSGIPEHTRNIGA
jgi:bile acid:Na+ symporter, BASS family